MLSPRSLVLVLLCAAAAGAQTPFVRTFDGDRGLSAPPGFVFASSRQADAGHWIVKRDGTQGWLMHAADPSASGFAIAVAEDQTAADVLVSARVRVLGGSATGGLVWRYQNDRNYYALVLDLSRAELSLLRVTDGNRIRLELADDLELDRGAWHTLKLVHTQGEIRVWLGGVRVFDEDDRRTAVPAAFRTGVVAAGDSEAWFDDLRVESVRRDDKTDRRR